MGKYLNMVRQAKEIPTSPSETGERVQTSPLGVVVPGCLITWGTEGTCRGPAVVDFLHTDQDGTVWGFVTHPDGRGTAVNMKFVRGSGRE